MSVDEPPSTDEVTVRVLLAAAGIPASDVETAALSIDYPKLRKAADLLHALTEARYESPDLHFDVTGPLVEWT